MQDKIKQILERELQKLDILSLLSETPMAAADVKSLDTLIKAYRTFTAPEQTPPLPDPLAPAQQTTADLLSGLNDKP